MTLHIFPGLPKRFTVNIRALLGNIRVPSYFIEDVQQLLADRELYGALVGLGQIIRFVPYYAGVEASQPLCGSLREWATSLPPYWKTQIVDYFMFELDEVVHGFEDWAALVEKRKAEVYAQAQQHDLSLRRDGLEDVSTLGALFEGANAEFELMRHDEKMRGLYLRHRASCKHTSSRLQRTKEAFSHSWWIL